MIYVFFSNSDAEAFRGSDQSYMYAHCDECTDIMTRDNDTCKCNMNTVNICPFSISDRFICLLGALCCFSLVGCETCFGSCASMKTTLCRPAPGFGPSSDQQRS